MQQEVQKFEFTSALTTPFEQGEWVQRLHDQHTREFKSRILNIDGIDKVIEIGQYEMEVRYLPAITDTATILKAVRRTIERLLWEGASELFPLRGGKTPTANLPSSPPMPQETLRTCIARLNTDIVRFPVPGEEDRWGAAQMKIAQSVVKEGVRGVSVEINYVTVAYDTHFATDDTIQDYIKESLKALQFGEEEEDEDEQKEEFFPYLVDGRKLTITFEVLEGCRV